MPGLLFAVAFAIPTFGMASAGPIEERRALMDLDESVSVVLDGFVRGGTPFDAARLRNLLQIYVDSADRLTALFPDDSKPPPDRTSGTAASPKVWQNPAAFNAWISRFKTDATAAMSSTDRAGLAKAIDKVAADCDACHEIYRIDATSRAGCFAFNGSTFCE